MTVSILNSSTHMIEENMQNFMENMESFLDSEEKKFVCLEGVLQYEIFIPSGLDEKTRMIVMLHGCKQNAQDFAKGTRMNQWGERENMIILYPQQQKLNNSHGCWSWFQEKAHSTGESSILRKMIERIKNHYKIEKIYAVGMSAGGAMANVLAYEYPELLQAVAIHSGLPYKAATHPSEALAAMQEGRRVPLVQQSHIPKLVIHGSHDKTVSPLNASQIIEDMIGNHQNVLVETVKGASEGRDYIKKTYNKDKMIAQCWVIEGLEHCWSGGDSEGSFTDSRGPDASRIIIDFFNAL